jgi:hypothetical protein
MCALAGSLCPRSVRTATLGESPRPCADHLSLAIRPKVNHHANQIVNRRVRCLIQQRRRQCRQRQDCQAELERAVQRRAGDEVEGPLEGEHKQAEDEVDGLQDGDGLHGSVEGLGEEVPEDLGPEEAFDSGGDLVDRCGEDDETSPVVLDKLAHFDGTVDSRKK